MPWPEDSVPKTFYPFPWIFHSFIPSAMSLSLGRGEGRCPTEDWALHTLLFSALCSKPRPLQKEASLTKADNSTKLWQSEVHLTGMSCPFTKWQQ